MALTKLGSTASVPKPLVVLCVVLLVTYVALQLVEGTSANRAQSGVKWNKESLIAGRGGWLKKPRDKSLLSLPGNKKKLPILAFFTMPDCPYSNLMERTVFSNNSIYSLINEHFFAVIVDSSAKENLPAGGFDDRTIDDRYHAMMVPRLVVAMPDGCPLWSFTGMRSCAKTYAFLKLAVKNIQHAKERAERLDKESERNEAQKRKGKSE